MKLSICIPTYDRALELERLLWSISPEFSTDIVICDDGSTDHTLDVVKTFQKNLCINYIFQENQGRSIAIVEAMKLAVGDYIILMDSDDFFTSDGLKIIFNTILGNQNEISFVFGVLIKKGDSYTENSPPEIIGKSLLSLRADYKIKGDLKEVTCKDALLDCIYSDYKKYRRVPTSLLWSCISEKSTSFLVEKPVIVKEYLPGGMTSNILLLKSLFPAPLVDLYRSISISKSYNSKIYRWRAKILMARYSFHVKIFKFSYLNKIVVYAPAFIIFIYDILILKMQKIRKYVMGIK